MTYATFGGSPADYTIGENGQALGGIRFTVWTALTGGVRVTDLRQDGVATPSITSKASGVDRGRVAFEADNQYRVLFLELIPSPGQEVPGRWAIRSLSAAEGSVAGVESINGRTGEITIQEADIPSVFLRKGSFLFDVADFGAVGDGVTDDTAAIQSALDACGAAGGGTVFLTAGKTYWMQSFATISSNTWIVGYGAKFIKTTAPGRYAVFATQSKGALGYGSGGRNIRISGLRIEGDLANSVGACLVSLHHAEDVLVEHCQLIGALVGGHGLDVCGSRGVTIRDCTFAGRAPGNGNKEAIQIDQSGMGSMSAPDEPDEAGSYDGLPSVSVHVEGCRFVPLEVGGVTYPAPMAMGSHTLPGSGGTAGLDTYYTDLVFRDNIVHAPDGDSVDLPRGAVHFVSARRVKITGNTFIAGDDTPLLAFFSKIRDTIDYRSADVTITDNTFEGVLTSQSPVDIRKVDGLRVSGNRFTNSGSSASSLAITNCSRILVTGNDLEASGSQSKGIDIGSTSTGRVSGNIVTGYGTAITANSGVTVAGDNITSV